jgi:hypothetical protein
MVSKSEQHVQSTHLTGERCMYQRSMLRFPLHFFFRFHMVGCLMTNVNLNDYMISKRLSHIRRAPPKQNQINIYCLLHYN